MRCGYVSAEPGQPGAGTGSRGQGRGAGLRVRTQVRLVLVVAADDSEAARHARVADALAGHLALLER